MRARRHFETFNPVAPSRRRCDVDTVVGFACALVLPLALWLA